MIRPFTCLCMLMAAASGLYLYQVKNRTRLLDRQIIQIMKVTDSTRARTGVLRAEWALQNDPQRLQDLADHFLNLRPLAPTQFVTVAELDHRLPPVSETPIPSGIDTDPDMSAAPQAAVEPRPEGAPKVQAALAIARPAPSSPIPTPAPASNAAPAIAAAKPANPAPATRVVASAPQAARLPQAMATASIAPTPREVINRIVHGGRVDPSVPTVASVLGAAQTLLAPPVPVSTAEAATYSGPR